MTDTEYLIAARAYACYRGLEAALDHHLRFAHQVLEAARFARMAGIDTRAAMAEMCRALTEGLPTEDPAVEAFWETIGKETR